MHIIGGKYKKRPLESPKGDQTRPTTSQLREAVFNICQQSIENATFLDLCAGSGAMGLEALSRGARHATFVDSSRTAITCIKKNIATLKVESQTTVYLTDALKALHKFDTTFDIIYLDPPYGLGLSLPILTFLDSHPLLNPGGTLFIEEANLKLPPLTTLTLKSARSIGPAQLFELSLFE